LDSANTGAFLFLLKPNSTFGGGNSYFIVYVRCVENLRNAHGLVEIWMISSETGRIDFLHLKLCCLGNTLNTWTLR